MFQYHGHNDSNKSALKLLRGLMMNTNRRETRSSDQSDAAATMTAPKKSARIQTWDYFWNEIIVSLLYGRNGSSGMNRNMFVFLE